MKKITGVGSPTEPYGIAEPIPMNSLPTSASTVTSGQLEAVALRFRVELDKSLHRSGTGAQAMIDGNVLTVEIEHSLSTAEHNLTRQAAGRHFFHHYIEELAEQMYPVLVKHIEDILPIYVTDPGVDVDCEKDSIVFSFSIRARNCWTETLLESAGYRDDV